MGTNHHREGYGREYGLGNSRISLFKETNFWLVFNITAKMALQGCCVPREQSVMPLAVYIPKMAKGGL
jgi:hypothetical protein